METKVICDDGSSFVVRTGADAGPGNGITIRGGAPSIALPPEISTPEFWERMDAIREVGRVLRDMRK